MCIGPVINRIFGGGNNAALQLAQQQQQQAAAAVAAANLDTEQSRLAAETQMRKSATANGFFSTMFGGAQSTPNVSYSQLYGS